MKNKKIKRSNWLPLVLLAYLAAMSYIGRGELAQGNYLYYFGIIGFTLAVIITLYIVLRRREKLASEREKEIEK